MRSSKQEDPVLLLALLAAVAGVAAWRWLSDQNIQLGPLLRSVAPLLATLGVGGLALALARWLATRSTLRSRSSVVVVPADEFDPSPESVMLFASQLTRTRRSVRGWLDPGASSVRVRLEPDPDGRLAYLLDVPARSQPLLRSALRSYQGLELRDASKMLPEQLARSPRSIARAELVLARANVEPLARLALDPDPLQPFASALGGLEPARGERACACIDLLPVAGWQRRRWRRRLLRQARRGHAGPRPGELLGGERSRKSDPADLAERRAESRALDAKLKDSGPLFHLQVLLRCEAAKRARARTALQGLLAAFEQLADRNWLRVAGLPIPGLGFLGSDLPLRRRWFDRRLRTGLFRPARRGVVSAREVAGFLKPPTVHCASETVLRSGALVSPAPELPTFSGQRELVPLGRIAGEGPERIVGVRLADTFFSYCAGRSRYGKTELAVAQFLHLVRTGMAGSFSIPTRTRSPGSSATSPTPASASG